MAHFITEEQRIERRERAESARIAREDREYLSSKIVEVVAERLPNGEIRLKYLALPGGCGPELTIDDGLAIKTINALLAVAKEER